MTNRGGLSYEKTSRLAGNLRRPESKRHFVDNYRAQFRRTHSKGRRCPLPSDPRSKALSTRTLPRESAIFSHPCAPPWPFVCAVAKPFATKAVSRSILRLGTPIQRYSPVQKQRPRQRLNRTTFRFNDGPQHLRVASPGTRIPAIVPLRVRPGSTNFFDNLNYPCVFINSILPGNQPASSQGTGSSSSQHCGASRLIGFRSPIKSRRSPS